MLTLDDYLQDRQFSHTFPGELLPNAEKMVERTNVLLTRYMAETGADLPRINSGWRPPTVNALVQGAAKKSKHMTCEAIDLDDDDGLLDDWCMENLAVLEEIGLWMEHPAATKGWCHLQIVPPRSGRRVFYP